MSQSESACGWLLRHTADLRQARPMDGWTDLDQAYLEIFGEHSDLIRRPSVTERGHTEKVRTQARDERGTLGDQLLMFVLLFIVIPWIVVLIITIVTQDFPLN